MLLPKPKKGETRETFLARGMASEAAKALPDDQRQAAVEKRFDDQGKVKSALGFLPQRFDGHFAITDLVTRAAGDTGTENLPAGCCAKMTGIALVYEVRDDYGTMFARGCLAQTIAERVRPGKVRLFADHEPRTKTHVGTVIDITDVGDTAVMTAVIFDTEAGRRMKEYLQAVTASGKETGAATGLSVGFRSREDESTTVDDEDGIEQWACRFLEIELREISVTPVNAVPGSDVLSVRRQEGEKDAGLLTRILSRILASVPESEARAVFDTVYASAADRTENAATATGVTPATAPAAGTVSGSESSTASAEPKVVPFDERMRIMREVMGPAVITAS
jgi:HK97 family phage prohead protease